MADGDSKGAGCLQCTQSFTSSVPNNFTPVSPLPQVTHGPLPCPGHVPWASIVPLCIGWCCASQLHRPARIHPPPLLWQAPHAPTSCLPALSGVALSSVPPSAPPPPPRRMPPPPCSWALPMLWGSFLPPGLHPPAALPQQAPRIPVSPQPASPGVALSAAPPSAPPPPVPQSSRLFSAASLTVRPWALTAGRSRACRLPWCGVPARNSCHEWHGTAAHPPICG